MLRIRRIYCWLKFYLVLIVTLAVLCTVIRVYFNRKEEAEVSDNALHLLLILQLLLVLRCIIEAIYLAYALRITKEYVATITKNHRQ